LPRFARNDREYIYNIWEEIMKKILLAALLGALTAYVWSIFSYMALPWHNLYFESFTNDAPVTAAIIDQAPRDGIYMIPNLPGEDQQGNSEADVKWMQDAAKGPYAYMWIIKGGLSYSMGSSMVIQFITQLLVAFLAAWLLSQTQIVSYFQRALFVSLLILAGSLLAFIPQWNWYGFPLASTIVNIIDNTLSYFFAGLVIARFIKPAQ
jgi:hypothetical protein